MFSDAQEPLADNGGGVGLREREDEEAVEEAETTRKGGGRTSRGQSRQGAGVDEDRSLASKVGVRGEEVAAARREGADEGSAAGTRVYMYTHANKHARVGLDMFLCVRVYTHIYSYTHAQTRSRWSGNVRVCVRVFVKKRSACE